MGKIWRIARFFVPLPIMSDGNFNRALLPHTPYASGMKAGKQIAKMHAVETLRAMLSERCAQMTDAEQHQLVTDFEVQLASKLK